MRRRAAVLLMMVAVALLCPPTAGAEPVPGSLGIRLVDAPVSARDDPRAAVAIVDDLPPGTVVLRRVEVSNGSAAPMDVRLYSTGADISDGVFVGHDTGDRDEISRWIGLDRDTLTVAPGGSALVTTRIAVPADAAPGERYGVVWAETQVGGEPGGIAQLSRVGVRLYLSVSGDNPPATAFEVTGMTASRGPDGLPSVTARVANTGGRAIDADAELTLTDGPGGTSAGPFRAAAISTIAPGQTGQVGFALDPQLPAGPWTARLTVTSGLVTAEATATLTFPDAGAAAVTVAADRASGSGVVLPLVIGVLVAALAVGAWFVLRRRAQKRTEA